MRRTLKRAACRAVTRSAIPRAGIADDAVSMVGWASTGIQMGASEATLKYAQERFAIRQADRLVPDGAGSTRQDARQRNCAANACMMGIAGADGR